jgi:adenylate cyclase
MTPLGHRSWFDRLTTSGFRIDAFRLALAVGLAVTALHFLEGQGAAHGFEVPIVGRLEHACEAALAMIERLDALRARWRARGLPDVDIGVGINTGPMSVGFVGSQDRFYNYTVLGDAVNLAARLEGANREYGTRILVGPETAAAVSGRLVLRALDLVRVKGKREPVTVFELLGRAPAPPELAAFLERFGCALSAYRAQRWAEAILRFGEADALRGGDPCARAWIARCEAMRRHPPGPEWDGVFDLETK